MASSVRKLRDLLISAIKGFLAEQGSFPRRGFELAYGVFVFFPDSKEKNRSPWICWYTRLWCINPAVLAEHKSRVHLLSDSEFLGPIGALRFWENEPDHPNSAVYDLARKILAYKPAPSWFPAIMPVDLSEHRAQR
ncbi:MAG: hypothetical protein A2359_00955 [Candidatus Moranbacteria bacterium RIFOXYB1_FULL_43_19]|nr:MAG: hypothetical protein A2184_00710 [Candidatus Moranbacteria bacterium RIFOXYA1_FULL_44_7]OGI27855.1 MAG: hypothetical protein A2359_00955 [Candidatus Moranbacteria bacterium RIFOXYB1_FULL_43_19]OGI34050.1 MAG: hypothetical protein A2420_01385 [Candidatus Moranbacteria bacterium RIFOXYC1_FULL_44_13]OGI37908.1 MAG: hypothetical protein A2612_02450 [Candidatus Moranbacteria bacterium RIFOXYD1_FULL_44_12]